MRWKQNIWLSPAALVFGVWLSVSYINPYGGATTLSSLVEQLSGARGDFPLGPNMSELLSFTLRLLPFLVFQALAGISFYRHYCTASVYIFSRMPNRLRWYAKECTLLALETLLYQALVLAAAIGVAAARWTVTDVAHGLPVLLCHLLIWSLWTFAFTLGVNLLAIFVGSSTAFAALALKPPGGQPRPGPAGEAGQPHHLPHSQLADQPVCPPGRGRHLPGGLSGPGADLGRRGGRPGWLSR